jgi:hypothetical protein
MVQNETINSYPIIRIPAWAIKLWLIDNNSIQAEEAGSQTK